MTVIEIASSRFAIMEMQNPRLYSINKLNKNLNALGSNYAAASADNFVYFTSSRPVPIVNNKKTLIPNPGLSTRVSMKPNQYLNAIYVAKGNPKLGSGEVKKVELGMAGTEKGAPTLSDDGKRMYFTGWSANNKGNYAHNTINQKLIFSSDGRVGLGGLDFFESKGDFTNWSEPKNMGYPLNSSKDDIYYAAIDASGTEAFISSDRESVCCLELFHIKNQNLVISGILRDCDTKQPLKGAVIAFTNALDSRNDQKIVLSDDGVYHFEMNVRHPFKITASKDNYFAKSIDFSQTEVSSVDTLFNPDLCLKAFEIGKPIVLKDILYEFDRADLTEASKIVLNDLVKIMNDNKNMEIEMGAHTDSKGSDIYNIDLSQRRAMSCVDYLVSNGISASRLDSKGYGESAPVASNTYPDCRQQYH